MSQEPNASHRGGGGGQGGQSADTGDTGVGAPRAGGTILSAPHFCARVREPQS